MSVKYYVKHGIAGYGPDLDEEDEPYSLEDLPDVLNQELNTDSEIAYEDANAIAEHGEYEEAWKTLKLSESLDMLARNFNPGRRQAPLYKDDEKLWLDTVKEMIDANFPLDVSLNGSQRLYVWEAEDES